MLEVLDPQQNKTFYDNYLGIPFDLSEVMFIATANNADIISEPLRDRMEIIQLSGYSLEKEKKLILHKNIWLKKQLKTRVFLIKILLFQNLLFSGLLENIRLKSGVRQLERLISKLCSKAARTLVETTIFNGFSAENLEHYLGPCKFMDDGANKDHQIGISNGLAWTVFGGEILQNKGNVNARNRKTVSYRSAW